MPVSGVEALGADPGNPTRLWAVGAGQLQRSDDRRRLLADRRAGPLPDTTVRTRAIAVASKGPAVTLATDRGLYRSPDAGEHWSSWATRCPLTSRPGPSFAIRSDPATLYAGFALIPYLELWRLAVEGRTVCRVSRPPAWPAGSPSWSSSAWARRSPSGATRPAGSGRARA